MEMEKHFCGDVWRSKRDSVWTGANWSEIGGKWAEMEMKSA